MKSQSNRAKLTAVYAAVLAILPGFATQANAATQLLRADTFTVSIAGSAPITMWGYAPDNAACGSPGATMPGPAIAVAPADPTLTVTLKNCLP